MTDTAHLDTDTVSEHTKQWLEKAVIGLSLCLSAKASRVKNPVRIVVSEARHLDGFPEDLNRELQLLDNTSASELETTLLVHPMLFPDLETFSQILEAADDAVVENESEGIVQIAPFYPDFQFKGTETDDISSYINRSPCPTLHLVREDNIARAAEALPDASAILNRNIALLEKMGHEGRDGLDIPCCPFPYHKPFGNN